MKKSNSKITTFNNNPQISPVNMSRRNVNKGLLQVGLGSTFFGKLANAYSQSLLNAPLNFDLSDPKDNVHLYVKMLGNLLGGRTYIQYGADIFHLQSKVNPKPVFNIKGIVRLDWKKVSDTEYKQKNFDHGLICDAENGQVINQFENPFTGNMDTPVHYRSGPFKNTVSTTKENGEPFLLDWQTSGGGAWFTSQSVGSRKNWLSPDEWPQASTGDEVHFGYSSTYVSEIDDLNNPQLTSVNTTHIWTFITPHPPWMLMGDRPGFLMWRWIARKVNHFDQLDPYIVSEISKLWPTYFTAENPWDDHINGWIQYKSERKPLKKPNGDN